MTKITNEMIDAATAAFVAAHVDTQINAPMRAALEAAFSFVPSPTWTHIDAERSNLPTVSGHYRVMVAGDSESLEGHTIYEFDDYAVWMHLEVDEDGVAGTGPHDEEFEWAIAWCGPYVVPKYKRKR